MLRGVTPALLSEVEERSREVLLLEEGASAILRGARLSRGLSCSKSRCVICAICAVVEHFLASTVGSSVSLVLFHSSAIAVPRSCVSYPSHICFDERYHEFLGGICMAGADVGVEAEATADLSRGDWSVLQCRVEEGFSRVSKVLDDGTIQVRMHGPLATPQKCTVDPHFSMLPIAYCTSYEPIGTIWQKRLDVVTATPPIRRRSARA